MVSEWPVFCEDRQFEKEERAISLMKEAVRGIRNVRTEMNVAPGKKAAVFVVSENEGVRQIFEEGRQFFISLAAASELTVQADKGGIDDSAVSVVIPNATVYIPFEELVCKKMMLVRKCTPHFWELFSVIFRTTAWSETCFFRKSA